MNEIDPILDVWPCTVIPARYSGVYEGAKWLAFNLRYLEVPEDAYGDDLGCAEFFHETELVIGRGENPAEAHADLLRQLR